VFFAKFIVRVQTIWFDIPDPKLGVEMKNRVNTLEKLTSEHGHVLEEVRAEITALKKKITCRIKNYCVISRKAKSPHWENSVNNEVKKGGNISVR